MKRLLIALVFVGGGILAGNAAAVQPGSGIGNGYYPQYQSYDYTQYSPAYGQYSPRRWPSQQPCGYDNPLMQHPQQYGRWDLYFRRLGTPWPCYR